MRETCDRCGPYVEAALRFLHPSTGHELTLCAHCAKEHRPVLREAGWETYRLVVPSGVGR